MKAIYIIYLGTLNQRGLCEVFEMNYNFTLYIQHYLITFVY